MDLSNLTANKTTTLTPLPHPTTLEKGSNVDYKSSYQMRMADWREATKAQAQSAYRQSPEYNFINTYIKFLENNPWNPQRPSYRSSYRNNKMGLARKDRLAKISDAMPTIDISTSVEMYNDTAAVLEGVIRAEWHRQNMSQDLEMAYDMALLQGLSFWKIGSSRNKLKITALGADQVIPIQPSLKRIQESAAIAHYSWKPLTYFHKVFPYSSAGIEANAKSIQGMMQGRYNRPNSMDQTTWDGLSTGMKRIMGAQSGAAWGGSGDRYYGVAQLEEYYVDDYTRNESRNPIQMKDPFLGLDQHNWHYIVKPGERLYPRKRLIIFGGEKLIYDGPSPYWHGMYPYAALWTNKVPWSFYGLSLYRDLLPMQEMLNQIPAGIADIIAKALNPQLLTKQNTIGAQQFQAFAADRPGARLILNNNAGDIDKAFVYQKPPDIPSYVPQMLQGVLNPEFDRLAGNVDVNALADKNQMSGSDTLDSMRDNLQTSIRREEKFIETFLVDAGQQAVSNVIQFYDTPTRMKILGADGLTDHDFLYDPARIYPGVKEYGEKFSQQFAMTVKPGSLNASQKDAVKIEAVGLVARQVISRKEYFRRTGVDPDHAKRIMDELVEEQQIINALTQGQGVGSGGAGGTRTPRDAGAREGVGV